MKHAVMLAFLALCLRAATTSAYAQVFHHDFAPSEGFAQADPVSWLSPAFPSGMSMYENRAALGMELRTRSHQSVAENVLPPGPPPLWASTTVFDPTPTYDFVDAATSDSGGNAYLVGTNQGAPGDGVIRVARLSSSGDTVWTRTCAGYGGARVATRGADAVGVAAPFYSPTGARWSIAVYGTNGVAGWSRTFDDGNWCIPTDLAFAPNGNLIVVGNVGSTSNTRAACVAFDSYGSIVWRADFSDSSGQWVTPLALAVSPQDDVYILVRQGTQLETLLKYDGNGTLQWSVTETVSNQTNGGLVADVSGNVIAQFPDPTSTRIQKYSPSGQLRWTATLLGTNPTNLIADGQLGIYAATVYGGAWRISRVDSAGQVVWSIPSGGVGGGPSNIALGVDGALYVGGTWGTSTSHPRVERIAPEGWQDWAQDFSGSGSDQASPLVTRTTSGVLVASSFRSDLTSDWRVYGLRINGQILGQHDYPWTVTPDVNPIAIAITSDGVPVVTGSVIQTGHTPAIITVGYSNSGQIAWTARHFGTLADESRPTAIGVDGFGNTFVAGSGGGLGAFLLTYGSNGVPVGPANPFGGSAQTSPAAMVVTSFGTSYVVGSADSDMITWKVSPTGNVQWAARLQTAGCPQQSKQASGRALCLLNNDIIVAGQGSVAWGNACGYTLMCARYSQGGQTLWTRVLADPVGVPYVNQIVANGNGVVLFATAWGYTNLPDSLVTLRLKGDGTQDWSRSVPVGSDSLIVGIGATEMPGGRVVVVGNAYAGISAETWSEGTVAVAYDSLGVELWRYVEPGFGPRAITSSSNGQIYIAGRVDGEMAVVALDSNGTPLWENRYNGGGDDRANAIVVSPDGSIIVSGRLGKTPGAGLATIMYGLSTTGVEPAVVAIPERVRLVSGNSGKTIHIQLNMERRESISFDVFDIRGRHVLRTPSRMPVSGRVDIDVDSSSWSRGVYFFRWRSQSESGTAKLVHLF